MLVDKESPRLSFLEEIDRRAREIERQLSFLKRFFTPRSVFLHLEAGDCLLALRAAAFVERVYALGVAQGLTMGVPLPLNLRLGSPREPVDIAFGERLEPAATLGAVRDALGAGGRYFFYVHGDYRQVRESVREAGFREIRFPYVLSFLRRQRLALALN